MIIKLEDADITTAQDDSEDRGVIHVPDTTWNHVIKEVEHQDQEWVNSLYIDVGTLSIGGSGLPIVIYGVSIGNDYSFNTWDMTLKEAGTPLTLTVNNKYALLYVYDDGDNYTVYYFYNNTNAPVNKTLVTANDIRYYITPSAMNATPYCRLYDSSSNEVMYFSDSFSSDQNATFINVKKAYIDFLWINN